MIEPRVHQKYSKHDLFLGMPIQDDGIDTLKYGRKKVYDTIRDTVKGMFGEAVGSNIAQLEDAVSYELSKDYLSQRDVSTAVYEGLRGQELTMQQLDDKIRYGFWDNALKINAGNKSKAAEIAGVNRRTVQRAVDELGIEADRYRINSPDSIYHDQKLGQPGYLDQQEIGDLIMDKFKEFKNNVPGSAYQTIDNLSRNLSDQLNSRLSDISFNTDYRTTFHEVKSQYLTDIARKFNFDVRGNADNLYEIAKKLGVDKKTVLRNFEKYDVPTTFPEAEAKERKQEEQMKRLEGIELLSSSGRRQDQGIASLSNMYMSEMNQALLQEIQRRMLKDKGQDASKKIALDEGRKNPSSSANPKDVRTIDDKADRISSAILFEDIPAGKDGKFWKQAA